MDYVRMGDILRERRAEYGLTERQLAKFVGISPVYYSQIERGVCHIDLETLVKLAEAFGCRGMRIARTDEVEPVLSAALAAGGPVVVDCRISPDVNVLPMIPPGGTVDDTIETMD